MNGSLKRIEKGIYESTDKQFRVELQPKQEGDKYAYWAVLKGDKVLDVFETIGQVKAYVAPKILLADSDIPDSDRWAMEDAQEILATSKAYALKVGKELREIDPDMFNQIAKNIKSKSAEKVGRAAIEMAPEQAKALVAA